MNQKNEPKESPPNEVEISCRFGERVIIDRGLLKEASDLNLDAPAKLIVTHQPFYAVYSVTRMLIGGQRVSSYRIIEYLDSIRPPRNASNLVEASRSPAH